MCHTENQNINIDTCQNEDIFRTTMSDEGFKREIVENKELKPEGILDCIVQRKNQAVFEVKCSGGIDVIRLRNMSNEVKPNMDINGPRFKADNLPTKFIEDILKTRILSEISFKNIAVADEVTRHIKIACIGDKETGKTSFIKRVCNN